MSIFTNSPLDDPKDTHDSIKWFIDSNKLLTKYKHNGHVYRLNKRPDNSHYLKLFEYITKETKKMMKILLKDTHKHPKIRNEIALFNSVPFTFSEMPLSNQMFNGLCMPHGRYIDPNGPSIGLDKNMRCLYREIFIKITQNNPEELKRLLQHEMSHFLASHIQFRTAGNHASDFKRAEKILKGIVKEHGIYKDLNYYLNKIKNSTNLK
jgi:hypothetical protein